MAFPPKPLSACAIGGRRLEYDMDEDMINFFNLCGKIQDMMLENQRLKEENAFLKAEVTKVRNDREEGFRVAADSHKQFVNALISGEIALK